MTSDKLPKSVDEATLRRGRQATALRENLRRRKAQSRARSDQPEEAAPEPASAARRRSTTRRP